MFDIGTKLTIITSMEYMVVSLCFTTVHSMMVQPLPKMIPRSFCSKNGKMIRLSCVLAGGTFLQTAHENAKIQENVNFHWAAKHRNFSRLGHQLHTRLEFNYEISCNCTPPNTKTELSLDFIGQMTNQLSS